MWEAIETVKITGTKPQTIWRGERFGRTVYAVTVDHPVTGMQRQPSGQNVFYSLREARELAKYDPCASV